MIYAILLNEKYQSETIPFQETFGILVYLENQKNVKTLIIFLNFKGIGQTHGFIINAPYLKKKQFSSLNGVKNIT